MATLLEVMLMLLIIFVITIPVIKHTVKIGLPRASNQPRNSSRSLNWTEVFNQETPSSSAGGGLVGSSRPNAALRTRPQTMADRKLKQSFPQRGLWEANRAASAATLVLPEEPAGIGTQIAR
ncbi:hypothetical protein [Cupriavidus sp. 8B]